MAADLLLAVLVTLVVGLATLLWLNWTRLLRWLILQWEEHQRALNDERRPKRIILIRHGESEGNTDKELYAYVPDNQLEITVNGRMQALSAGSKLKDIIGPDETVMFYVSPFVRSQQTYELIARSFAPDKCFMREDPRIREQEWGNFQDLEEMELCMAERERVGRFFYRFPDGESGADVFDRVSSFLSSFFREFRNKPYHDNVVIVSHGLLIRLFLMRYYRWSVEKFHSIWNFDNCEWAIMERKERGRYELVTPLRANWIIANRRRSFTGSQSHGAGDDAAGSKHKRRMSAMPAPGRKSVLDKGAAEASASAARVPGQSPCQPPPTGIVDYIDADAAPCNDVAIAAAARAAMRRRSVNPSVRPSIYSQAMKQRAVRRTMMLRGQQQQRMSTAIEGRLDEEDEEDDDMTTTSESDSGADEGDGDAAAGKASGGAAKRSSRGSSSSKGSSAHSSPVGSRDSSTRAGQANAKGAGGSAERERERARKKAERALRRQQNPYAGIAPGLLTTVTPPVPGSGLGAAAPGSAVGGGRGGTMMLPPPKSVAQRNSLELRQQVRPRTASLSLLDQMQQAGGSARHSHSPSPGASPIRAGAGLGMAGPPGSEAELAAFQLHGGTDGAGGAPIIPIIPRGLSPKQRLRPRADRRDDPRASVLHHMRGSEHYRDVAES